MANKLISELSTMSSPTLNTYIEVQGVAEFVTKKMQLSDLLALMDAESNMSATIDALVESINALTTRIEDLEAALGSHKILATGKKYINNVTGGDGDTITVYATLNTLNYIVLGAFVSDAQGNPNVNTSQAYSVFDMQETYFKVRVKEIESFDQTHLWFYYIVIGNSFAEIV